MANIEMDDAVETSNPNAVLLSLLSAHGVSVVEKAGWLFPGDKLPGLRAVWHPQNTAADRSAGSIFK